MTEIQQKRNRRKVIAATAAAIGFTTMVSGGALVEFARDNAYSNLQTALRRDPLFVATEREIAAAKNKEGKIEEDVKERIGFDAAIKESGPYFLIEITGFLALFSGIFIHLRKPHVNNKEQGVQIKGTRN